ncbi:P450-derived glycosyltransferase activator [Nocardia salmonicida]|uniref:cytochrome P450 family protein n=1 Tax=Nocardia salmonicida TaxID=53431 RepID=UPI00340F874B
MPVNSELGRRLQLIQGLHWLYAADGDPYATLLRGFDDDLQPIHQSLRERGRLWPSRTGTWVTGRYSDSVELIGHSALGTRYTEGQSAVQQVMDWDQEFGDIDPGESHRLGEAADALLAPASIGERYEQVLRSVGDEFDLLADVAERISVDLVADLFEVSASGRARLAENRGNLAIAADSSLCPQRLDAGHLMLSALTELRELLGGRPLGLLYGVLGVRISADLLAKAVLALLEDPEHWTAIADDPARAAKAVDETLRYDPPVQVQVAVAQRDFEAAGQHVPAGSQIAVVIAAANRDPEVFAAPDRFDPDRNAGPRGSALTPGGPAGLILPFARAHAEAALQALSARFPGLRVNGDVLRRRRAPLTKGLLRLPVASSRDAA